MKEKLTKYIYENCEDQTTEGIVDFLLSEKMLKDTLVIRPIIKEEYFRRLKSSKLSGEKIRFDLEIEFNVSENLVRTAIYNR